MTRLFLARAVFFVCAFFLFSNAVSAKILTDSTSGPAPVFKPNYFTASSVRDLAILQWEAAPGSDISHYEIEHSVTGAFFSPLACIVPGKEESYTFKHSRIGNEPVHYYRIKKVNKDGTVSRSFIRVVRFK